MGFHSHGSDVQQVLPEESSCVSHKVRPKKYQNIRVWSRKRFSVRAKQEEQVSHAQKTQITQWFSGKSFEKQIWDEGCRVCDLLVDGGLTG